MTNALGKATLLDNVHYAADATAEVLQRVVRGLDQREKDRTKVTARSTPPVDLHVWSVRQSGAPIAPAWTDGQSIWVADSTFRADDDVVRHAETLGRKIDPLTFIDVKVFKGAVYHELSHVLYSPRGNGYVSKTLRSTPRLARAWNILEDHRIETLFATTYTGAVPYFSRTVYKVVLAGEDLAARHDTLVWVWGRRYLPAEVRNAAYARFVAHFGLDLARHAVDLIDSFVDTPQSIHSIVTKPSQADRVGRVDRLLAIVRDFADLLDLINANLVNLGEKPTGDGSDNGHDAHRRGKAQKDAPTPPTAGDPPPPVAGGDDADGDADSDGAGGDDGDDADADGTSGGGDGGEDGAPADDSGDSADTGKGGTSGDAGDPADAADGASDASDGEGGTGSSDALDDAIRKALDAAERAVDRDSRDIKDAVRDRIDGQSSIADNDSKPEPVTAADRVVERRLRGSITKLTNSLVARTERRTRSGRINGPRWERTKSVETAFDRFHPSAEGAANIDIVIALDHSGSIGQSDRPLGAAAWAIKSAVEGSGSGNVSVLAFDTVASWLYRPGTKVAKGTYRFAPSRGGTNPTTTVGEALRVLRASKAPNKLLVVLTDGGYTSPAADRAIAEAEADGITTLGIFYEATPYWVDDPNYADTSQAKAWKAERSRRVVAGGSPDYAYGASLLEHHGFGLTFTVSAPLGFVGVIDRVVDSIRSAAVTGRPSRWVAAQQRVQAAAEAAKSF